MTTIQKRVNRRNVALGLVSGLLLALTAATVAAQDKIPIKSQDDLPRHTYKLAETATELLQSDEQFAALAKAVRVDVEADLAKYQIEDASTLQRLYNVLVNLDLLEGRFAAALKGMARIRGLETKEAKKLMSGLVGGAYVAAREQAGQDDTKFRAVFRERLLTKLRPLPWGIVADDIKQRKGQTEIITEPLLMGMVSSAIDPAVAKTGGEISADIAQQLVSMRFALKVMIPLKEELVAAFAAVVAEHDVAKKDIWAERAVTLSADQKATPVVIGIWDSGVDTKVFEKQLVTNAGEQVNGQDDDQNGFVDDVHGIAFDVDGQPTPELLHPLDALKSKVDEVAGHMKGFMDVQAAIDSPEASAVKKTLGGLQGDAVRDFIEDLSLYGNYAHGTHVAGIALEGNPFARLIVARLTFDYHMLPKCPTLALMRADAALYQKTVDYFKQHGVRVVNMSWGEERKTIEQALEKNGVGATVEERAQMTREMFKIMRDGLYNALQSAPDILFVCAAGNSDNDVEFDDVIPSSFNLPNVLVVGAVDQAGEPTGFTSFGQTVQAYANGFEVDSFVPGGKRMKLSGTSMASPNVANLAAKLLALDPTLKPAQVIERIKQGADKVEGQRPMLLINPRRTVAGPAEK